MATISRGTISRAKARPLDAAKPRLLDGATIGVVGAGQIGGSIIRRLAEYRPALVLAVFDLDASLAPKISPFARVCRTLADLVRQSDVVVLAVPVQAAMRLLPRIAAQTRHRTSTRRLIVGDTSTVKAAVASAAARHRAAFDFVGLHPLAGTEGQGWSSANPALFDRRPVVICRSRPRASRIARELVGLLGGIPVTMNARDHDRFAAAGIGLPHILAFAAAGIGGPKRKGPALLKGGSWRSLTRVAASNAVMVAGFLHANRRQQLRALARLQQHLETITRLLGQASVGRLEKQLSAWQRKASRI